MSGGDGIDFSTQVPAARHVWASMFTSRLVRHEMTSLPEDLGSWVTCPVLEHPGVVTVGPGAC
jgi:hypothetical protein